MPTPDKLYSARLKIERAKQHIADLQRATQVFFATEPYKIGAKHDPQTRKLICYLVSVEDVPPNITLIAGDAIQTLRSALDQLAYQLFLAGSPQPGASAKHVYFPVFGDATKYKTGKPGKVKGMRQDAIKAIDAIEPYKGGKGHQIWVLNELNNADKHRLVFTVGSAFRSIDLGAVSSRHLQQIIEQARAANPAYPVPVPPIMHVHFKTDPMMAPLKAGDELYIGLPDEEVNKDMQFRFDIAISEPGIIEGKSLIETLNHLANFIDGIVTGFAPLL
jgi:hypothetical protein